MGVTDLWKDVSSLQRTVHIKSFHGRRIGVDAANWIHQGAIKRAWDLANGSCDSLLRDLVNKAKRFEEKAGWKIVFVFDGIDPPMKAGENRKRLVHRHTTRQLGVLLLQAAQAARGDGSGENVCQAAESAARSVLEKDPVVGEYESLIFTGLLRAGFEAYVAPMEAEAQLASMCRAGDVYAVLSEDTDTIMYFSPRVIKRVNGVHCDYYDFTQPWDQCGPIQQLQDPTAFVVYCVLSGCDYLQWSIGVRRGQVLAAWIAEKYRTNGMTLEELLTAAIHELASVDDKLREATVEMVIDAAYAVLHHFVFDGIQGPPGQVKLSRSFPIPADRWQQHGARLTAACGDEVALRARAIAAGGLGAMAREGASILEFPPRYGGETVSLDDDDDDDGEDGCTDHLPPNNRRRLRIPPCCTAANPPQYIPLVNRRYDPILFACTPRPRQPPRPPQPLGADIEHVSHPWWCSLCGLGGKNSAVDLPKHVTGRLHVGRVHLQWLTQHKGEACQELPDGRSWISED